MEEIQSKIEAILFASGEPVEIGKIATFFKLKKEDIKQKIDDIVETYKKESRGLQIIQKENTIQLVSSATYGEIVASFLNRKTHEPLSQVALEVLAVVAYRGPITRAQIEHVRGVNCSFTLRNLAIRGIVDRKDNPADNRSYIYEISHEFLKNCGISSVSDLPEFEILHDHKIPQERENEGLPKKAIK